MCVSPIDFDETAYLLKSENNKNQLLKAIENIKDRQDQVRLTWHIAEVNYDLARLDRQRGNTELDQQHYDTAHQIFQQLGVAEFC